MTSLNILFCVVWCCSACVVGVEALEIEYGREEDTLDLFTDAVSGVIERMNQYDKLLAHLTEKFTQLEEQQQPWLQSKIESSEDKVSLLISHVLDRFDQNEKRLSKVERLLQRQQEHRCEQVSFHSGDMSSKKKSSEFSVFSIYACRMEIITITCNADTSIQIDTANFGQYANLSCADTCCMPHATDCVESVQENQPTYWEVLIDTCNNKNSCEFQVPSATMESCLDPYQAEYLEIQYTCKLEAIGFTVTSLLIRNYDPGDVVIFDRVVTNLGAHFDIQTSLFTCPVKGTYIFSTSLRKNASTNSVNGCIMHEGICVTSTSTSSTSSAYDQGSTTAVITCNMGESVWIGVANIATQIMGSDIVPYSSFTGLLINA